MLYDRDYQILLSKYFEYIKGSNDKAFTSLEYGTRLKLYSFVALDYVYWLGISNTLICIEIVCIQGMFQIISDIILHSVYLYGIQSYP